MVFVDGNDDKFVGRFASRTGNAGRCPNIVDEEIVNQTQIVRVGWSTLKQSLRHGRHCTVWTSVDSMGILSHFLTAVVVLAESNKKR
jgi:hypothetical protein